MKIEVNISKRYAFAIIGLLVVLIVGGFVYASHTPDASVNHGINQITGIPECTASQVLTHRSGGGVVCVTDMTGSGGSCSWQSSTTTTLNVDLSTSKPTGFCKCATGAGNNPSVNAVLTTGTGAIGSLQRVAGGTGGNSLNCVTPSGSCPSTAPSTPAFIYLTCP